MLFLGRGDHPAFNTVQYLRLASETIDATLAEVRALARDHGRHALTWEIASTAAPPGLAERLLERGMRPADPPLAVIMALGSPPPAPPPGITVSRVATVADFRTFVTVTHEVFGALDRLPAELERIDREGAADLAEPRFVRYLAWMDGAPVAAATAAFTPAGVMLHSGSTRPDWRGRGAYRALVAARWEDAVRAGTPLAVTRAGAMSRPILRQSGFTELAEIRFLEDRFG
ncbi:MAG TPA: hypothetical protein VD886_18310 [Herpetosiphonaceae bacterium]|nr:hypothetical protein [Herpetosiphonaceae bacterium]